LGNTIKVDMGDLDTEKENLANFLHSQFALESKVTSGGLAVKMEDAPAYTLAREVTKFVYRKNLNGSHWVKVENNVVKIHRFKKLKAEKKNKHPTTASTIKTGW